MTLDDAQAFAELSEATRAEIDTLLDDAGITENRGLVKRILATGLLLGKEGTSRLDLKITSAAIAEMRDAFRVFAPHSDARKVTIFGSARTTQVDPLYRRACEVAAALSADGWIVVTGAGPGIMQAAVEGAGSDMSLGVSIRLPFEEVPTAVAAEESRLVQMKYFFTRKLMLVKESSGFICLPGGFGTMDEMFELLTLQQTGKAEPMPIVLLDEEGGTFWTGLKRYVEEEMIPAGVISPHDLDRALITDSVDAAVAEITGFWRNYVSLRWVGSQLVLRLRHEPTKAQLGELNRRFAHLCAHGRIERTAPLPPEVADQDELDRPRLVLTLAQREVGSLFTLIRAINELAPTS